MSLPKLTHREREIEERGEEGRQKREREKGKEERHRRGRKEERDREEEGIER